ncbi:MAG: hypothetical protein QF676_06135 [Dehalococcoidia bacterium]|nr:hypothetical protein [Chloroflexota bacterium]MDP7262160.1 hypothetical protein [Dehalococcoidia bacterium]
MTRLTSNSIELPGVLEAIETYFENGWSDGLPVVPPTPEAVTATLEAANLRPDAILGIEPVKGAVITAEKAAINAIMAGCKPEYMPVVVAAIGAITQPEFNLHGITVSTMGAAILLVVNGPITEELGINSKTSAFGPGYRANATIGRAIRLLIINVLGTRTDDGLDKATLGHPGKYSWCIAENEDDLPYGWTPMHVTRGVEEGKSAVTVFPGLSATQFGEHEANTPEGILDAFAQRLYPLGPGLDEVAIIISPEHAAYLEKARWQKEQVGNYLFENARKTASEWTAMGLPSGAQQENNTKLDAIERDRPISVLSSPESAIPIVVGGAGGGWSAVIPTWSNGSRAKIVTRAINLSK